MINKIKGKKAGEKLLSIWLFIIFAIIGVAIVAGVLIFYSVKADTREAEADILATRIADCLFDYGYLRQDFSDSFDIFQNCNLNKDILDSAYYYFKISVYENNQLKYSISGKNNFEIECTLPGKHYPKCIEKEFLALDKNSNLLKIKISAGSNYIGEK